MNASIVGWKQSETPTLEGRWFGFSYKWMIWFSQISAHQFNSGKSLLLWLFRVPNRSYIGISIKRNVVGYLACFSLLHLVSLYMHNLDRIRSIYKLNFCSVVAIHCRTATSIVECWELGQQLSPILKYNGSFLPEIKSTVDWLNDITAGVRLRQPFSQLYSEQLQWRKSPCDTGTIG